MVGNNLVNLSDVLGLTEELFSRIPRHADLVGLNPRIEFKGAFIGTEKYVSDKRMEADKRYGIQNSERRFPGGFMTALLQFRSGSGFHIGEIPWSSIPMDLGYETVDGACSRFQRSDFKVEVEYWIVNSVRNLTTPEKRAKEKGYNIITVEQHEVRHVLYVSEALDRIDAVFSEVGEPCLPTACNESRKKTYIDGIKLALEIEQYRARRLDTHKDWHGIHDEDKIDKMIAGNKRLVNTQFNAYIDSAQDLKECLDKNGAPMQNRSKLSNIFSGDL